MTAVPPLAMSTSPPAAGASDVPPAARNAMSSTLASGSGGAVRDHTACQFDHFYFNLADLSIFFHMRTNSCVRHWCTGAMCDFDKSLDLANLLFSQVPWLVPFR